MLDINKHLKNPGWSVIGVFADPKTVAPTFSYTVGLSQRGLPELLMLGVPTDAAHRILNDIARRLLDGERFEPGQRLTEVSNFPLTFSALDDETARGICFQLYLHFPDARVMQVIWPSPAGIFPGEPGFEARFAIMQNAQRLAALNERD